MLTKTTVIDRIEVVEGGGVQVRRATYIDEDGVRISGPVYSRAAYVPGADISHEDESVRAVALMAWTPVIGDVVRAYADASPDVKSAARKELGLKEA